jgi:hypothetical protein
MISAPSGLIWTLLTEFNPSSSGAVKTFCPQVTRLIPNINKMENRRERFSLWFIFLSFIECVKGAGNHPGKNKEHAANKEHVADKEHAANKEHAAEPGLHQNDT